MLIWCYHQSYSTFHILKHYDTWKIFISYHHVPNNILRVKKMSSPLSCTRVSAYDSCLWITPEGLSFTGNHSRTEKSGQWNYFKGIWVIGKIMQVQAKCLALTHFRFIRFQIAGINCVSCSSKSLVSESLSLSRCIATTLCISPNKKKDSPQRNKQQQTNKHKPP